MCTCMCECVCTCVINYHELVVEEFMPEVTYILSNNNLTIISKIASIAI